MSTIAAAVEVVSRLRLPPDFWLCFLALTAHAPLPAALVARRGSVVGTRLADVAAREFLRGRA